MTAGTGKRQYRACQRCRRRKTKCELDTVGEPRKPPCLGCYRSGSECVLADSRRGGHRTKPRRPNSEQATGSPPALSNGSGRASSEPQQHPHVQPKGDFEFGTEEELSAELRNTSDALQILANHNAAADENGGRDDESGRDAVPSHAQGGQQQSGSRENHSADWPKPQAPIDNYELVAHGLLDIGTIQELLRTYKRHYHPYFPLAPSHLWDPTALRQIQREDFFLLTVILTIASRDREDFSLIHIYCWDHAQRILLDVLLAQPWTQTPRTVEALLLLSEWLPHIRTRSVRPKQSKTPLSDDRTAWSLVGQAVRHAYLLKLDRAAFRNEGGNSEPENVRDHKRLIWTFIYVADRQISVRLGQSFWSRGPSLSSRFTAADFPSLRPSNPASADEEDFSLTHQATLELTQMLHNAHDVLYSSRARTLALVFAGDYGCYIDDFQTAAAAWNATWAKVARSSRVQRSLALMYEYLGVYINAFSFQAVVTRWSSNRLCKDRAAEPGQDAQQEQSVPIGVQREGPFGHAVMASPDGRYIFDALSSARKILSLMSNMTPDELCSLPTKYHLYGVYGSVFLYKAEIAGAMTVREDREEANLLVQRFITALGATGSSELHVARQYGPMLQRMWRRKGYKATDTTTRNSNAPAGAPESPSDQFPGMTARDISATQPQQEDTMFARRSWEHGSTMRDFPTPRLAEPDTELIDMQTLDALAMQDFSDVLDPWGTGSLDFFGVEQGQAD